MVVSEGSDAAAGLRLDGVTVAYGETVAVDDVSLELAPGEVVALLGPSGCGKSTLLRAVAGLEPLAAGSIAAGGRSLDGVPTHERDLGLMFQEHVLFDHLDVAGNIAYGLARQGRSSAERSARVAELLEVVGLGGFGTRLVSSLSGGEAQRVALARALAPSPSLVMLDEPLGALDRGRRDELTEMLHRVLRDLGQTALHVTHDQTEAFAVADRVAVMRAGRIEQLAEPSVLWRSPANRFVAEFVGHRNFVEVDGALEIWPERSVGMVGADAGQLVGRVESCRFDDGEWVVVVAAGPSQAIAVRGLRPADVGVELGLVVDADAVLRVAE